MAARGSARQRLTSSYRYIILRPLQDLCFSTYRSAHSRQKTTLSVSWTTCKRTPGLEITSPTKVCELNYRRNKRVCVWDWRRKGRVILSPWTGSRGADRSGSVSLRTPAPAIYRGAFSAPRRGWGYRHGCRSEQRTANRPCKVPAVDVAQCSCWEPKARIRAERHNSADIDFWFFFNPSPFCAELRPTWGLWEGWRWWWGESRCPAWIQPWRSGTAASPWRKVWLYDDTWGPEYKYGTLIQSAGILYKSNKFFKGVQYNTYIIWMLDASQPGMIKVVGLDIHISIILMGLMTEWICFLPLLL